MAIGNKKITTDEQILKIAKGLMLILLCGYAPIGWCLSMEQRLTLLEEYVVVLKQRISTLENSNIDLSNKVSVLNETVNLIKKDRTVSTGTFHFAETLSAERSNLVSPATNRLNTTNGILEHIRKDGDDPNFVTEIISRPLSSN